MQLSVKERECRERQLALFNSYRAMYERASDDTIRFGKTWYPSGNRALSVMSQSTGHPFTRVAGVTAVLSPGTRWKDNLKSAYGALTNDWDTAWGWHSYGSAGVDKAKYIVKNDLSGQDLYDYINTPDSRKVPDFYRSLLLEDGAVCVDTWMYRINKTGYLSGGPPKGHVRSATRAVKMLASRKGIPTYTTQAILWLQKRKEEDESGYEDPVLTVSNLVSGNDTE